MDDTFNKMKDALFFAAAQNCLAIKKVKGLTSKQRRLLALHFGAAVLGGITPIACDGVPEVASASPEEQMLMVLGVLEEDILTKPQMNKGLVN